MLYLELEKVFRKETNRRSILKAFLGVGLLTITGWGIFELFRQVQAGKGPENPVLGQFLGVNEWGELVVTNDPMPVKISLSSQIDKISSQANVPVRSAPVFDDKTFLFEKDPLEIKAIYGVRVAGGKYSEQPKNPGNISIELGGKNYPAGEWFMLTNQGGHPIDPIKGSPLREDQQPYFVAASFVTVKN